MVCFCVFVFFFPFVFPPSGSKAVKRKEKLSDIMGCDYKSQISLACNGVGTKHGKGKWERGRQVEQKERSSGRWQPEGDLKEG